MIGGGLAGIAAAAHGWPTAGARVMLLEARPHLGGATYSFQRGDLTVDTGQHVFLRCYDTYRALLGRLGSRRPGTGTGPLRHPGAAPAAAGR